MTRSSPATPDIETPRRHEDFVALAQAGRRAAAEAAYQAHMDALNAAQGRGAEGLYGAWVNYAVFMLNEAQKPAESVRAAQEALKCREGAEAYHNLAQALLFTGRHEEGRENLRKAVAVRPDFVPSLMALAWECEKAGEYKEALPLLRQARHTGTQEPDLWLRYAHLFQLTQDFEPGPELVDDVFMTLQNARSRLECLVPICQKLFRRQPVFKKWQERAQQNLPEIDEGFLRAPDISWAVLNHRLFVMMLERLMLFDPQIEGFMTATRRTILRHAVEGTAEKLWDRPLYFMQALAQQAFLNEYIYFVTDEEHGLCRTLQDRIAAAVAAGDKPDAYELAAYATYEPLYKLECAEALAETGAHPLLENMLRRQLREPLIERHLAQDIPDLTPIDDVISRDVKSQYEENPYPRWLFPSTERPQKLMRNMKASYPFLRDEDFAAINADAPDTLIAGCGTGKQVVDAVNAYAGAYFTGVDLSLASVAYAQRKVREAGITNVTLGLGDILNLRALDRQFDMIHCGGVLHHMRDPMAGWRVLYDMLKPGGFMMIALYSERARRMVVAAREFIAAEGYPATPDGMRAFRAAVHMMPADHPVKPIMRMLDFYTLSMCRDLVFHVQEHRFTPLQLKESIEALNLEFLGFEMPGSRAPALYRDMFPDDPHGLDLTNWDVFEERYPDAFLTMFQFWLRKPLDG